MGITKLPILYLVCILVQITLSMAYTIEFTVMMDNSDLRTAGTDYTLQASFLTLSTILAGTISGAIAEALGYIPLFIISIAIGLASVVLVTKTFKRTAISSH